MMEWLILLLLVPAILVPLVLLFGFAGCELVFPLHPPDPGAPANPTATALGASRISVAWDNPNAFPVRFEVRRTQDGASVSTVLQASASPFEDTGLLDGTAYFYQVRAIRIEDAASSELSDSASATTFAFQPAFENVLDTDQAGIGGYCLVQRIEPARLSRSGAEVRITLRGSTAGNLLLDNVFISQPAAAGDPYDSGADLTQVSGPILLPAGSPATLPAVNYVLDSSRPVLIAFDIGQAAGNLRYVTGVPASEAVMYFRPATAEAGVADRLPSAANPGATPYDISASIYLIEKIEVA